jgi:hypothetical protein
MFKSDLRLRLCLRRAANSRFAGQASLPANDSDDTAHPHGNLCQFNHPCSEGEMAEHQLAHMPRETDGSYDLIN